MALEIKEHWTGKWKLFKRENQDAYIEVTGLNALEKKLAKTVKPKLKIWVEDDNETIVHKLKTGVINDTIRFKFGEEYEKEYLGHKVKGTATWKDGQMHTHIISDSNKEHYSVREIVDGFLVSTSTCEGVTTKSYFKRKVPKQKK